MGLKTSAVAPPVTRRCIVALRRWRMAGAHPMWASAIVSDIRRSKRALGPLVHHRPRVANAPSTAGGGRLGHAGEAFGAQAGGQVALDAADPAPTFLNQGRVHLDRRGRGPAAG